MRVPCTYWTSPGGRLVGYWNDYPDHWTEGRDLAGLEAMLRDLRSGIEAVVAAGGMPSSPPSGGGR